MVFGCWRTCRNNTSTSSRRGNGRALLLLSGFHGRGCWCWRCRCSWRWLGYAAIVGVVLSCYIWYFRLRLLLRRVGRHRILHLHICSSRCVQRTANRPALCCAYRGGRCFAQVAGAREKKDEGTCDDKHIPRFLLRWICSFVW